MSKSKMTSPELTPELVQSALAASLTNTHDSDVLDYLVELIVEAATEAQTKALQSKFKKKRALTLYDFLSRAVEDTLLDAETTLGEDDIVAVIETANAYLHAKLYPKEEMLEQDNHGYNVGAHCVAIMPEDDEWHEAEVVSAEQLHTKQTIQLRFVEFGNIHDVKVSNVVLEENIVEDNAAKVCAMCERPVNLTEHHLIPRQVHARYLKKGFTREFLNRCIDICRSCHSKIHSTEDNRTLAAEYNTLEKLMAHESIQKYVNYARKQKPRMRIRGL
ncbi:unnamed protein product [Aphanomyces euteiches]|uniref:Tudor domain-containing protein n=1 Tax=Aphanomyces euteiches TaxID=100861 RepID=A0A6G0WYB1_9STRA|nr:hypothetical protein Ae201684_010396 [Aphanomyces euteiches]KAH9090051.1 hypothetical protein Ae201684P_014806 [Aphanomyces euteiches]